MKIIFLDIDGVFIPSRAYKLAEQTSGFVTVFDPCAVGMINDVCVKTGARLVIHSSWLRCTALMGLSSVTDHMLGQGLKFFHEDSECNYTRSGSRWLAISDWLSDHPEVEDYFILDDEEMPEYYNLRNHIRTDFDEGITFKHYKQILEGFLDG